MTRQAIVSTIRWVGTTLLFWIGLFGLTALLMSGCQGLFAPTASAPSSGTGILTAVLVRNNTSAVQEIWFSDSTGANRYPSLPSSKLCWAQVNLPNVVHAGARAQALTDAAPGYDWLLTDSTNALRPLTEPPCA